MGPVKAVPGKEEKPMDTNGNRHDVLWKSLFYSGGDQLLVAQKGCAVSFPGDIQMLSGYGPG